jgi:hypothetical protein
METENRHRATMSSEESGSSRDSLKEGIAID